MPGVQTTLKSIALAAFVMLTIISLTACGSDEKTASKSDATATATAKPKAKAKPQTQRTKIIKCVEDVGYTAESPNGDARQMIRVKSPAGRMDAVILFFPTAKRAEKEARSAKADGLTAASFGKVYVTYAGEAVDPSSSKSRVITDCVS